MRCALAIALAMPLLAQAPQGVRVGIKGSESKPLEAALTMLLAKEGLRPLDEAAFNADPQAWSLELSISARASEGGPFIGFLDETLSQKTSKEIAHSFRYLALHKDQRQLDRILQNLALQLAHTMLGKAAHAPSAFPGSPEGLLDPQAPPPVLGSADTPAGFPLSDMRVKYQAPQPPYPTEAKAARIGGTVDLRLFVDPQGSPVGVLILSGPLPLQEYAARWAMDWRFDPFMDHGRPVFAHFPLKMIFHMN